MPASLLSRFSLSSYIAAALLLAREEIEALEKNYGPG